MSGDHPLRGQGTFKKGMVDSLQPGSEDAEANRRHVRF